MARDNSISIVGAVILSSNDQLCLQELTCGWLLHNGDAILCAHCFLARHGGSRALRSSIFNTRIGLE